MKNILNKIKNNENSFFIIILVLVSYLSLTGLNNNVFWDDEAHVAIFAKNNIKTGHLSGWDGKTLFTYRNGTLLNKNLQTINPPLEYLITGLAFKLFGYHTWAGRIFFVFLGIMSLIFLRFLLNDVFGKNQLITKYSLLSFSLSYSFLLNIRQCRYYSLILLFSIITFWAYRRFIIQKKAKYLYIATLSLLLLFFSQYLLCIAIILSIIVVHFLFFYKNLRKKDWINIVFNITLFSSIIIPFAIINKIWYRPDIVIAEKSTLLSKLIVLFWNIREIDLIGYLPFLIFIPLIIFIIKFKNKSVYPNQIFEFITIIITILLTISLLTPQPAYWLGIYKGLADIRYLFILLPFTSIIMGTFFTILHKLYGGAVSVIILTIYLSTNAFSLSLVDNRFRWLLPAYILEIHNDYKTSYDSLIEYLKNNIPPNDTIACMPLYARNTLSFYLSDNFLIAGDLKENTPLSKNKLSELDFPAFEKDYFPQWFICMGMLKDRKQKLKYFSRGKYVYVLNKRIDVIWKDQTRPELPWHSFTKPKLKHKNSAVFIFKRVTRKKNYGDKNIPKTKEISKK